MILIKDVEILTTERDYYEIECLCGDSFRHSVDFNEAVEGVEVVKELIRGRRFVHPNGTDVVIGMSNSIGEILGLQYEMYEDMRLQIDNLQQKNDIISIELNAIKKLNFWKRLLCLFSGIKKSEK